MHDINITLPDRTLNVEPSTSGGHSNFGDFPHATIKDLPVPENSPLKAWSLGALLRCQKGCESFRMSVSDATSQHRASRSIYQVIEQPCIHKMSIRMSRSNSLPSCSIPLIPRYSIAADPILHHHYPSPLP